MKSPLDALVDTSVSLLEAGLRSMHDTMRLMHRSIGSLAAIGAGPATKSPLEGPTDSDEAVSALGNRLVRIARTTPWAPSEMGKVWQDTLNAIRRSFRYLDLRDPRSLAFPIELPLSIGTLLTEMGLRGLSLYQAMGARRASSFAFDVLEMFSEIHVFVGVHYDKLLAQYRERLAKAPADHATRLELGRTLIKCGLFLEAAEELNRAAADPAHRAAALHEAAVACYRAGRYAQAAKNGTAVLAARPSNERARAWLWLTAQKLGGYPADVPPRHRMEVRVGRHPTRVQFQDIAAKIGLDKTSGGRGLAVFDFNGDGHLDVVIAGASAGCSLFRNNGDGTFTDVSIGSGLDECVNAFIVAAGDYNNDGFPDLYITRLGFFPGDCNLYRNNGDGTFTDVTAEAGVGNWGPAFTASWVDYDGDGHLDLFVANNLGSAFERKVPDRLFRNNGDGTFTDVSEKAGIRTFWPTIGSAWGDYNNDGYPDLFLSNAMGRSCLFRNNGDGTFTDVSRQAGIDDFCIATVVFWCDYDNDGWLDLVQFIWSDHEDVIHTMRTGEGPRGGKPLRVYHNKRDGTFTMRSRELGLNGCWGTMSGNAGDFNNDGQIELVLGNGSPRMDRLEPLVLLERDGDSQFRNVTFSAGLPFAGKSHGTTLADLFGDGRLSILVASGGAYPGDLLTASVYCPTRLPGNYLNVRLAGTRSNRDAIGARVALEAGGRRLHGLVSGGTNFGCLPLEQHFGLGEIERVDALEIVWPSGIRQRLENLPINRTIRIREAENSWEDVYLGAAKR